MKKLYYIICGKYRKFVKPKISYLLEKALVLSIICSKCKNEDEKLFKEEESIEILKILGLIENIYFKNMVEENISQEYRLKNLNEIRNYFLEQIKQNQLMNKRHKKICRILNHNKHTLILVSTITGCISISTFASLIGIPIGIMSSAIKLRICAMTPGIKKYKSIIKKKKKKLDKIAFFAKSKLNKIEVLISKTLIDSLISHDEFVLRNNILKEYKEMKEDIKNLKA